MLDVAAKVSALQYSYNRWCNGKHLQLNISETTEMTVG